MNINEIIAILQNKFSRIEQCRDNIFKAYSAHKDIPFALWLFDCSETVTNLNFDIRVYQEGLLREDFYRNVGSIQWNLYCYFLCDEESINSLHSRGVVDAVENDRVYARKFVRTPTMLHNDFVSLKAIATEPTSGIPIDVGSLWQNKLSDEGLPEVFSNLPYSDVVRRIKAGQIQIENSKIIEEEKRSTNNESHMEFIEGLDLSRFRHRPKVRQFVFGDCNLIHGANGAGKTSILESIEAWICGRHRRNPDERIAPESIKLKIRGVLDWQPGPKSSVALYRERDHEWYGNYQARNNDLCFNFARFNFYDADAAARLEISGDDKEIETALSRLVLGESATRVSERINRLLPIIQREERECSTQIRNTMETIRIAREAVDSLKQPTESENVSYEHICAQLPALGWKLKIPANSSDGCLNLLDIVNNIAVTIEFILTRVPWLQDITPLALEKEKESIKACCVALKNLTDQARSLDREKRGLADWLTNVDRQAKMIKRRLMFSETGAEDLIELAAQQRKVHQQQENLLAAKSQIRHIDLLQYNRIDEPVAQIISRVKHDLDQIEHQKIEIKSKVVTLETVQGRITSLLSEVRAKAQELLETDAKAQICPVCGAHYEAGELLELLRRQLSHVSAPELQNARTELERINKESNRLNSFLRDMEIIRAVSHNFLETNQASTLSVKKLVASLLSLEGDIAQCNVDLTKIQHDYAQFHAKGFSEEELIALNGSIEGEFPGISIRNSSQLEQQVSKLTNERLAKEIELKKCLDQIAGLHVKEREILNRYLRTENSTSEIAQKRLNDISIAADRVNKLYEIIALERTRTLSDVLLSINLLRKTIEGVLRFQKQAESATRLISENEIRIKTAKETLDKLNPVCERLRKAIGVLEDIQNKNGAEKYVQEFFSNNIQQISDLFSIMHAPRDFARIEWQEENDISIRAIRKWDSVACPVSKLSSGQRNALSLAVFLTMNRKVKRGPSVIMLDDPVTHVDDLNIVSFFDCLRELLSGCRRQIFFATANAKTANLFKKKFDHLGPNDFREFKLEF